MCAMPALFTRMSRGLLLLARVSKAAVTLASSATSHAMEEVMPLVSLRIAAAAWSALPACRSRMIASAPAPANAAAMARPMPLAAPVMTARLPSKRKLAVVSGMIVPSGAVVMCAGTACQIGAGML